MVPIDPTYKVLRERRRTRIILCDGETEKCTVLTGFVPEQADIICAHLNLAVEHGRYASEYERFNPSKTEAKDVVFYENRQEDSAGRGNDSSDTNPA